MPIILTIPGEIDLWLTAEADRCARVPATSVGRRFADRDKGERADGVVAADAQTRDGPRVGGQRPAARTARHRVTGSIGSSVQRLWASSTTGPRASSRACRGIGL